MQYITYYDVSRESIFSGLGFTIFISIIFTIIAIGILCYSRDCKDDNSEHLKKWKLAKIWAWLILFDLVTSWYFTVEKRLENKNIFNSSIEILTVEGPINNYENIKKSVGLVSFKVGEKYFETSDAFEECSKKDCGLYNGLNVRITYTYNFIHNLRKNPENMFGFEILKDVNKENLKILKIELNQNDYEFVQKRNKRALIECGAHVGICDTNNE